MVSAYFSRCGVSVEFLPMGQKYNSQFFTETVLLSTEKTLAECLPKLRTTAAHFHVYNAKPHTSKMSIEKTEELGFILAQNNSVTVMFSSRYPICGTGRH
jgi:hypothetical protein